MEKHKAVIVDDEPKLREVLGIKLERYCPDISIVGYAKDANEGYHIIKKEKPDLVFLDIAMPQESGFDMLDRFESINFEIIFVTGYNEYALDALKVSAVDYLLKPVRKEDLEEAVSKAKERIKKNDKINRIDNLKHNLNNIGNQKSKIAIPGVEVYEFVKVEDIIRCEGWQKYTKIHLKDGTSIVSSYNIGMFNDLLEKYGFYCVHKSHVINTDHIAKYHKDGTIYMSDQSRVPLARRRKDGFIDQVINKNSF